MIFASGVTRERITVGTLLRKSFLLIGVKGFEEDPVRVSRVFIAFLFRNLVHFVCLISVVKSNGGQMSVIGLV